MSKSKPLPLVGDTERARALFQAALARHCAAGPSRMTPDEAKRCRSVDLVEIDGWGDTYLGMTSSQWRAALDMLAESGHVDAVCDLDGRFGRFYCITERGRIAARAVVVDRVILDVLGDLDVTLADL